MRAINSITKSLLIVFILGVFAAGCASSKCDCPKVDTKPAVATEIQV